MIKINKNHEISEQDLDYLMVAALEGGINYWCGECRIVKNPTGFEYASEVVAYGGTLEMIDVEEPDEKWTLTRTKLLKGVERGMEHYEYNSVQELMDSHDADTADVIVQYALFDEIVFG